MRDNSNKIPISADYKKGTNNAELLLDHPLGIVASDSSSIFEQANALALAKGKPNDPIELNAIILQLTWFDYLRASFNVN